MKYIQKKIVLEPNTLRDYRNNTPEPKSYKGFGDTDKKLKKALLNEQGYLCGYCMKKIVDEKYVSVEHYISQEKHVDSPHSEAYHKRLSLIYNNMIGVCINNGEHCDKSRGNIPFRILNPHQNVCESLITYNLIGEVVDRNNSNVAYDIELLKLNCQPLKELRINLWEDAKTKLIAKHSKVTWTKKILETEKQFYTEKSNGKYSAFCNYIIFRFNELIKQPKYNS
ncbi:HNH endonuclease family protein [Moheibacter sediminis]|uniref:TIGR02646 family protein n=1 Tax=Moheibacter sediminis TaxID=1434700 RepID=A0A1W2AF42_9FLAO|nr:hypothetical protein [Moheibacter sediminis]SMC59307.1 TIGR02646 family protein [Moheibacter sediminis]